MRKPEILTLFDDHDRHHHHLHESLSSPSSSSSPPYDRPPTPNPKSIAKSLSYSRLNAKALEFIPRSNSTSSLIIPSPMSPMTSPGPIVLSPTPQAAASSTQQTSFVIPQPPGPPTLIHVYTTTTSPTGATTLITHVPAQGAYHVQPVQYNTQIIGGQQQEVVALTVVPQPVVATASSAGDSNTVAASKSVLSEEVSQKILNQVEYYFSDINVATTDHLIRFMNKDPEGYVPISVVASFKKIKALISCNIQLANILRNSEKLVVSEDGKRVKRQHHLTKSDMEELQSRIVVAENLPEDHCHQSLLKIFSAAGSVKSIRTCQPQASTAGGSGTPRAVKSDGVFYSNKLHAFVEYETYELAEKAIAELNDENNWRNGLKVRLLLKPKAKPYQARAKKPGHENEPSSKDSDATTPEDSLHSDASPELSGDEHGHESEQKKICSQMCSRGRGKGRGRPQYQPTCSRGSIMGPAPSLHISAGNNDHPIIHKQPSVPRMPDGTRGFSMGRGKAIAIKLV